MLFQVIAYIVNTAKQHSFKLLYLYTVTPSYANALPLQA